MPRKQSVQLQPGYQDRGFYFILPTKGDRIQDAAISYPWCISILKASVSAVDFCRSTPVSFISMLASESVGEVCLFPPYELRNKSHSSRTSQTLRNSPHPNIAYVLYRHCPQSHPRLWQRLATQTRSL